MQIDASGVALPLHSRDGTMTSACNGHQISSQIDWRLSASICSRTRKVVIYAWQQQSHGKLWWKLASHC